MTPVVPLTEERLMNEARATSYSLRSLMSQPALAKTVDQLAAEVARLSAALTTEIEGHARTAQAGADLAAALTDTVETLERIVAAHHIAIAWARARSCLARVGGAK